MKRSYQAKAADNRLRPQELSAKTAIHEAGHAAAIYLGNKQKQLPPVSFQIFIKGLSSEMPARGCYYASDKNFAQVKGGRLIHTLPSSIQEAIRHFPADEKRAYLCAFEADIINLLVGPLAEAKYVALSDNEPINPRLVNLDSLHYYGGSSDLKVVREYLDCLSEDRAQKEKKIFELFLAAYDFINDQANWNAITALADYIVETGKKIIDCEEVFGILDAIRLERKKASKQGFSMHFLRDELAGILDGQQLTSYFQPIISLSQKRIVGYEALIRGPFDSRLHSPLSLFDAAKRCNLSDELEFACRESAIRCYASFAIKEKLFLNVSPAVLLEPKLKTGETLRFLKHYGVDPASVVIELTEHQPTDDYPSMREAVTHYRDMGFEIALDDLGAGYSGLRLWSELLPDYVKIDKHFIQGLHEDPIKLNFVQYIQNMAIALNSHVIAEGIETVEEFHALEKLGINYAQGYYFAKPEAIPLEKLDGSLWTNDKIKAYKPNPINLLTVAPLVKIITPVPSETKISDVLNRFQSDCGLIFLPLVDNDLCSGIISRDIFFNRLNSSCDGIELDGKKSIQSFIDKIPLSFDENTSLDLISNQLTLSMRMEPAFIISKNGKYKGIVTVLDVLGEITRQQDHTAISANLLPNQAAHPSF